MQPKAPQDAAAAVSQRAVVVAEHVFVLRIVTWSVGRCDDVKRLMKADETLWASDHRALVVQFRCA